MEFAINTSLFIASIKPAYCAIPDSKLHGANMGPIWGRQDPGGPHVGPMNLAFWDVLARVNHRVRQAVIHVGAWYMLLFMFTHIVVSDYIECLKKFIQAELIDLDAK